jgi:hypothetical protein
MFTIDVGSHRSTRASLASLSCCSAKLVSMEGSTWLDMENGVLWGREREQRENDGFMVCIRDCLDQNLYPEVFHLTYLPIATKAIRGHKYQTRRIQRMRSQKKDSQEKSEKREPEENTTRFPQFPRNYQQEELPIHIVNLVLLRKTTAPSRDLPSTMACPSPVRTCSGRSPQRAACYC